MRSSEPKSTNNFNLNLFANHISNKYSVKLSGYNDLHKWSVNSYQNFWSEIWDFTKIVSRNKGSIIYSAPEEPIFPRKDWFPEAKLNFASNLLRFEDLNKPALVYCTESGPRSALTFPELVVQTKSFANFLIQNGVTAGDRVAAIMPNMPNTVVAALGSAAIGAIFSSASPDFGIDGLLDRFSQISPKILVAADSCIYGGKEFDLLPKIQEVLKKLPSVTKLVICKNNSSKANISINNSIGFDELIKSYSNSELEFADLPFDHPLYIMYSSGTTGAPKCIVHGAGGTLIQHLKEHALHGNVTSESVIFYYTTCGWMMWNWLISALACGATVVLYDGSPIAPNESVLFDLIDTQRITHFGISPRFLATIQKKGITPKKTHSLNSLQTIFSTGSPLLKEQFDFVYDSIKSDVQLSSISGGTDIISCFALGVPTEPVKSGEIQGAGLGMDVAVFDESGAQVVGSPGELVCKNPFPSMPIYFWNDPENEKYRSSYFDTFPKVWRHGDWAEQKASGSFVIYGRADATLNPGGVRIGTAEIYRQVDTFPEVLESVVIGQAWDGDTRIVLFVRLREGAVLNDELSKNIRNKLKTNCSPRHVPAKIIKVNDIPRTVSGKIVELAISNAIHNKPIKNIGAIANPEALENFRNLPELKT